MNSLFEKLQKSSKVIKGFSVSSSPLYEERDIVSTDIPMLNVAFSGDVDGGYSSGVTLIAGPSKHFKTLFGLLSMRAYLDKYEKENAVTVFYDSEFGTPPSYFNSLGIDTNRVLHIPVTNIEEMKHDIVQRLEAINRGDKVFLMVDSLGNVASKKEVEDAQNAKSVADMTRAKAIKSFFRVVQPQVTAKNIPMFIVNHIYMSQDFFPKAIVSGGTGQIYNSDTVFIIGRRQEKDKKELTGYEFVINVEKSRFVKEKSKIPINVSFEEGINTYSGMLETALETGHVYAPKQGWYAVMTNTNNEEPDKLYRKKDTNTDEFWNKVFYNNGNKEQGNYVPQQLGVSFRDAVKEKYMLSHILQAKTNTNT